MSQKKIARGSLTLARLWQVMMETIFAELLSVHSSDGNTGGNGKGAKGYSRGTHSVIRLRICSTERHYVHSRKPTKMMKEAEQEKLND